jgi:hypothetical protein
MPCNTVAAQAASSQPGGHHRERLGRELRRALDEVAQTAIDPVPAAARCQSQAQRNVPVPA